MRKHWGDSAAKACVVYYCLCGLCALALDLLSTAHTGRFVVITDYSLPVMRWAIPLGCLASLAALIGQPQRPILRIAAFLMLVVCALGSASLWGVIPWK